MYVLAAVAIIIAVAIGLFRAFRGPTLFDRILAANMIGAQTVLLVAVIGFLTGSPEFLDIAVVYVLISFVGTVAILRVCARCLPADSGGRTERSDG